MKIPFSWKKIWQSGGCEIATYRAKVFGGWLIWQDRFHSFDAEINNEAALSDTMIFVSDPKHEWEI